MARLWDEYHRPGIDTNTIAERRVALASNTRAFLLPRVPRASRVGRHWPTRYSPALIVRQWLLIVHSRLAALADAPVPLTLYKFG